MRARNRNEFGPWSAEDTGTPVPNPSIGVISAKTKSQTGATLTVTIERSDIDNEQTVHLRHRVKSPPGAWKNATPQDTDGGSVDFDISDLTGNTVYEVEAWLAADTNDIAEYELTTNPVVPARTGHYERRPWRRRADRHMDCSNRDWWGRHRAVRYPVERVLDREVWLTLQRIPR